MELEVDAKIVVVTLFAILAISDGNRYVCRRDINYIFTLQIHVPNESTVLGLPYFTNDKSHKVYNVRLST